MKREVNPMDEHRPLSRDDIREAILMIPVAVIVVLALWLALGLIFAIVPGPVR